MADTEMREMLELAARAAGYSVTYRRSSDCFYYDNPESGREQWDPRDDSGDALRLAVRLRLDILSVDTHVEVYSPRNEAHAAEPYGSDADAATRLAILRCAAEVGRRMG